MNFTQDVGVSSHIPKKITDRVKVRNASGSKFGINPSSTFSTPLGIYSYPIDLVLRTPPTKNGFNVPFAGGCKFIQVFKSNGNILNLKTYSEDDLLSDIAKLNTKFPEELVRAYTSRDSSKKPAQIIWDITRNLSSISANTNLKIAKPRATAHWSSIFRFLGYDGVVDYGTKIIFSSEPIQAVFFDITKLQLLETVTNINLIDKPKK